jgi:[ribosomal protein S5]-alanine N-acetyltransferase
MLPSELPVITHPPIMLRPFRDEDTGLIQSVATDRLIPLITTVPASGDPDDARAYLVRQHDRLASSAGYSFAIADAATGHAVGQIGLWLANISAGRASTGYWLASRFRRRGYATAALTAISRWGFSLDGVRRIEAYVEPWNEGSWRAAENAGFRREGLMRSWQQVGPERVDMYMYSLLPHDLPTSGEHGHQIDPAAEKASADQQIAAAMAAERESLSLECRADPARFERLLAPDFHEFGASGGEIGYQGTVRG